MPDDPTPIAPSQSVIDRVKDLFPWMSDSMITNYATVEVNTGNAAEALQEVRRSDEYQQVFGGNYDPETGEVRLTESDYISYRRDYESILVGSNLNPSLFEDQFVQLLENDVDPNEFLGRMEVTYDRVMSAAPEIRRFYAENYGVDISDAGIMASVLNPDMLDAQLSQQITQSEIGGFAAMQGFGIDTDLASRLRQQGVTGDAAQNLFAEAAYNLPILDVLQRRHEDPEDEFDLNDFLASAIFDDPDARRQIRTIVSSERASFGTRRGFTDQQGSLRGLVDR